MNERRFGITLLAFVLGAAALVMTMRLTGCSFQTCQSMSRRRPPTPVSDTYTVQVSEGIWHTRYRDRIPNDKQVGCDVCPFWCTQYDLTPTSMDELIPYYVYQVNRYFEEDVSEDNIDQLARLGCMAALSEPAERARFLEFLQHSDPRVRYAAAVHALGLGIAADRALATLRALAAEDHEVSNLAEDQLANHEEGKSIEL
jgi:hypothetical protein